MSCPLQTLHAAPPSAAPRGEATIQPAYFTSSLFVDAFHADMRELERIFSKTYYAQVNALSETNEADSTAVKPFTLFKTIWKRLGWQWLHLKVLEPRARETFVKVVLRLLLECTEPRETPMLRVVGLFALYTFYMSQPSTSEPRQLQHVYGISISIGDLEGLLDFPETLAGPEKALKPYTHFILETLQPRFLILPSTDLQAHNPRTLPREEVRIEADLDEGNGNIAGQKKAGRPSKAERAQRVRAAAIGLDRWLVKSSYPSEDIPAATDPAGAAGLWRPGEETESEASAATEQTTHVMLTQRPLTSLNSYRTKKAAAVSLLEGDGHADAVDRAGNRVLRRLKEIDAAAAERGLEVGTEGGELSAIGRVESAINGRRALGLLEGGGLT